jgi:hypothetical protein
VKHALVLLSALFVAGSLAAPAAASSCFTVEGQSYCYAWSAKDASMMKTEYVRSGETVDHWKRMVTILQYNDVHTLEGATAKYMAVVRPYMDANARPQWVTPKNPKHAGEAATRLLLSSPDGSDVEYVVVYFFSDPGKPAYVIAFSQRVPLPNDEIPTMAQYGAWLNDLRAIVPANVER